MIDFLFWLFLVPLLTAPLIAIVAYCIGVAAGLDGARAKRRRVLLWPVDSVRAIMQQHRARSERINKIKDELL